MNNQFVPTGDFAEIEKIANGVSDRPVLMVNLNKYFEGEYPNGTIYKDYMKALDVLLEQHLGSKILWRTLVYGTPLGTQPLDEIFGMVSVPQSISCFKGSGKGFRRKLPLA